MRRSGRYTFIARTSKEKTEQKETTEIRFNENNVRDDHTGKMTTTEMAEIEAWKDDAIINECGIQFATVWGSSKKASTRQICDNMVLESLCPKAAEALFRGRWRFGSPSGTTRAQTLKYNSNSFFLCPLHIGIRQRAALL